MWVVGITIPYFEFFRAAIEITSWDIEIASLACNDNIKLESQVDLTQNATVWCNLGNVFLTGGVTVCAD